MHASSDGMSAYACREVWRKPCGGTSEDDVDRRVSNSWSWWSDEMLGESQRRLGEDPSVTWCGIAHLDTPQVGR